MEIDKVRGVIGIAVFSFLILCGFGRFERREIPRQVTTIEIKRGPVIRAESKTVEHYIEDVSSAVRIRGFANLLRGLIHQESGWKPHARRAEPKLRTASIGLTQVLGTTARGFGVKPHELTDPETSVWVGALYLKDCIKHERGDQFFALACYNAGPKKNRGLYPKKSIAYARSVTALKARFDRGDDPRSTKRAS
jgi:hypothetical protein